MNRKSKKNNKKSLRKKIIKKKSLKKHKSRKLQKRISKGLRKWLSIKPGTSAWRFNGDHYYR